MNRNHASLKPSPQLFEQVLDASGVAMAIRTTDLKPIFVNKAFADFYGYSVQEMFSLSQDDFLTNETVTLYTTQVQPALCAGRSWEGEYSILQRGNQTITVWGRFDPVLDASGCLTNVISVMQDSLACSQTAKALKVSEDKFRLLAENITDVIWTMDNAYNFTYATPSVEDVWGYTLEELKELSLIGITVPESHKVLQKAERARAKVEAEGNYDHINRLVMEHYHGKGGTIWIETAVRRLLADDGSLAGYQGVSRDITLRKQTEDALFEREARYRTLFEDSPISLWEEDLSRLKEYFDMLKTEGVTDFRQFFSDNPQALAKCATLVTIVDVNKATLELLSADSKEELFGNLEQVLTDSSMTAFTEEMILLASGGSEYYGEITNRTLKGEIIWVVVHFVVPPEYKDTLSRVIVSLLDVSPRKRAEQALMDSEERYRVLAENSQEGVVVIQNREIKYINESMTEIFGFSTEELEQVHPLEMVHPDDKSFINEQFRGIYAGRENEGFATFRILLPYGEIKWLTISIKPIMWEGKEALLEILTDITHHKNLEKELLSTHAQMEDNIRRRTAELSEANIQLKAQAEERDKARQRILVLTQELIRIQEDERQRIARDLHDNVAQDLSSIMLKMETLFDDHTCVDGRLRQRGESVADILKKAIASVRDIAYGLRPPALAQLGLVKSLQNLCLEEGNKHGFIVDFVATGIENIFLDFDSEINIYRMVQEAVRNIVRHAQADSVTVRLVKSHPDIFIRIEDNGKGFMVQERKSIALTEKRMGLRSMEERARLIGGSMEIQSLVGTGTRILFRLPTHNSRSNA
ncbi:PAS domain S-box protein [uncultured Pseudodesulfovibrio sp.]|uniref:PAS domain-containing sensor histidine kinase n=1 Tax=uncultured Pseudodesulfovibrio sp. TaxID=2035858 RepID=UPI0029C9293D|nr:PAS domain S-box protein [uncultured Pseudodesulfovibrio sp.]